MYNKCGLAPSWIKSFTSDYIFFHSYYINSLYITDIIKIITSITTYIASDITFSNDGQWILFINAATDKQDRILLREVHYITAN